MLAARLVFLGCWLFCAFQSLAGGGVASRLPLSFTHSNPRGRGAGDPEWACASRRPLENGTRAGDSPVGAATALPAGTRVVVGFTASAATVRRSVCSAFTVRVSVQCPLIRCLSFAVRWSTAGAVSKEKKPSCFRGAKLTLASICFRSFASSVSSVRMPFAGCRRRQDRRRITLKKLECPKRARRTLCVAYRSNRSAWNDRKGPRFYFVGL
jgi:hypothetical protein